MAIAPDPQSDTRGLPRHWLLLSVVLLTVPVVLSIRLWHSDEPSRTDRRVGRIVQSRKIIALLDRFDLGQMGSRSAMRALAELGGPIALLMVVVFVVVLAWRAHDTVLVLLAIVGPLAAGGITEWVGKPLVDRRLDGVHLSFPSGHVTGAAAIATLLWITIRRLWPHVPPQRALALWLIPLAVAFAVVRSGWHVATDTFGGVGIGVGVPFVLLGIMVRLRTDVAHRRAQGASPAQS